MSFTKTSLFHEDEYLKSKVLRRLQRKISRENESGKNYDHGQSWFNNRNFANSYKKELFKAAKTKYTQEAVYKKISMGSGKSSIKALLDYVSRSSKEFKDQEIKSLNVYNEQGQPVNYQDIINEWSLDFASNDYRKKHPERYKTLSEFYKEVQILTAKECYGDFTQNEADRLLEMRSSGVQKNVWEKGTQVSLDHETRGNIYRIEKNGKVTVKLEDSAKQKYKTLPKNEINPLFTKEGWGISTNSESDTLNDYIAQTPSFDEAKKALPKDFEHLTLSVGGDKPNTRNAFKATQEHLFDNLAMRGWRYCFVMHEDSKNLHFHVVVHKKNSLSNKIVFPYSPQDTYIFRKEYSDKLNSYGIDQTATLKKDRPNYMQITQEKVEKNLQKSKSIRSQKKSDQSGSLFASYYSLNEALDNVKAHSKNLKGSAEDKKRIIGLIEEARVNIKLDDPVSFNNAVEGFKKSIESRCQMTSNFINETLTPEVLKSRTEKKKENSLKYAIEAQEKQTVWYLKSYKGMHELSQDLKKDKATNQHVYQDDDKKEQAIELNFLMIETADMIIQNDRLVANAKSKKPNFTCQNDIHKYLGIPKEKDKKETKDKAIVKSNGMKSL